jgi:hypothetical protein
MYLHFDIKLNDDCLKDGQVWTEKIAFYSLIQWRFASFRWWSCDATIKKSARVFSFG